MHFAQEKANLVITGRNKEALEAVEKECGEKGAAKVITGKMLMGVVCRIWRYMYKL